MLRSLFGTRVDHAPGDPSLRIRRQARRSRARRSRILGGESLEDRTLLATVTVHIFNNDFSANPKGQPIVDPTINVGDTIHWVWDEGFHSTQSVVGQAETWDSGVTGTVGDTFDHTFTQPGTFVYYCIVHGFDNGNGTAGGMTGTITVVAGATLSSISVTPANPSIAKGLTRQFTATGTYSDTTTQDLTGQVTWASADTTVATISNTAGSRGRATAVATGATTISATLDGVTGSSVLTVTAAVLQSLAVTPANPSIAKGLTRQFTATGTYTDSTTQDLTGQVTWATSDTTVATISAAGLASGVGVGTSTISATLSGTTGTTVLTVTAAVLQSIAITPANPSIAKGTTESFTATGTYSDSSTQDLTSQVTWASSDTTVATISNTPGSQGQAAALAVGTSTLSAGLDGITGTTVLTVIAATLESIAVAPSNPSVAAGGTPAFTATGTYSDSSTQDLTSQVTWASSDTTVATISNASGSQGQAAALAVGTSSISATLSGTTGTTVLTVTAAVLQSIAVTPANPSVTAGKTRAFTATGTFSDSSTQDLTSQVTWASSDTTVATISPAGLATGVAVGSSTITATLDGIAGTTVLTVTAAVLQSLAVTPANPSIAEGLTQQFTATGTYTDSSTQDLTSQVTWASSDTAVATISAAGLATGEGEGTSTISAMFDGISGSTVLTVTPAVLQSIAVTPANPTISKGLTQPFTATGTYSDSSTQDLTRQVTWASSDTTVATISTTGLASGVGAGTSTLSAALGGTTGTTVLTVTAAVLQSITLTPANPSIPTGLTQPFTATGTYSDSSTQDLTRQVTWASSDTTVATISNAPGSQGTASALATGTSTISAMLDGVAGTTILTVTAAVLQSIAITPANPSAPKGTTESFTATGTYSDSSTQDLTSQVTWASADITVATISNTPGSQGHATALATGASTISAALGTVTATTTLTVAPAALALITITPEDPTIAKGLTQQFTATGTLTDGSTEDLTSQVLWDSNTPTVATISNATGSQGLAAAVDMGMATITATLDGITGSSMLMVDPAALVSIAVTPTNPSIAKDGTQQFVATGTYTDSTNQDLTSQVAWTSSDAAVATVSAAGLGTGVDVGSSTITATLDGITDSTTLTVTAAPPLVLNPVAVKDNGQGGYFQYGKWTTISGGYNGTVSIADPVTSSTANNRWMLTVPAGTYDLWASWIASSSNATNTAYSIYDGFTKLDTVTANQQVAPADGEYAGMLFAKLGTLTVTNGKITVALSAGGADGDIVADAILLTPGSSVGGQSLPLPAPDPSPSPGTPSSPGDPVGPTGPGTVAGQGAATNNPEPPTPAPASVPVPSPAGTTAGALPITVSYGYDSPSTTGEAASSTHSRKHARRNEHPMHKVKARHQRRTHGSLINHLAREQAAHKKAHPHS